MKSCPECNKMNNDNAQFCENCGIKLDNAPEKQDKDEKPSILLIILGYALSLLGIFSMGILSIFGLVLGIILFRRGGPDKIHGIIISILAVVILLFVALALGALFIYRSYFYSPA
jgi:uncharacterized membrane protein YvbJ